MAMPASGNEEKPSSAPSSVPAAANGEADVQPPAPPVKTAVDMETELLMAARRGDSALLGRLLGVGAEVVVDVVVAPAVRRESAPSEAAAGGETGDDQPTRPSLLDGVTAHAADSALHVVAACGDGDEFLDSATVIHGAARHLLGAVNSNGDTPVHCAARAGHPKMVSRLIALAGRDGAGAAAVRALLRKENERGETALHEAVRVAGKEMVGVLLSEDPELARFPAGDSTSPLYLAVQLGHDDIARKLHDHDSELSYSGPDGQNALHAAVLRGEVPTTEMLLGWNKHLTKQGDLYKTTPLHLAAWAVPPGPAHRLTALLLEADPSPAYVMTSSGGVIGGSFPVHLAALVDRADVLADLLAKCPDCAGLRDDKGRTFLHVAARHRGHKVVAFACRSGRPELARILNARDKDGNTALHLAVQEGDPAIVICLVRDLEVQLSLENNKRQTPLNVAWRGIPHHYECSSINSRSLIHQGLEFVGAKHNLYRPREQYSSSQPTTTTECYQPDDRERVLSMEMTNSAQTLGIGSVLITTVTFAAAFTLPGGYVADDHASRGAPTLAGSYAFDAFVMSITLAFACSLLATFSLMYSGVPLVDLPVRHQYFLRSRMLAVSSVRSLAAAFALGVYVVLGPVARKTAIFVCLISSATLLYGLREVWMLLTNAPTLYVRRGARGFWALRKGIFFFILYNYWSYLIIFGWPAYSTYRHI